MLKRHAGTYKYRAGCSQFRYNRNPYNLSTLKLKFFIFITVTFLRLPSVSNLVALSSSTNRDDIRCVFIWKSCETAGFVNFVLKDTSSSGRIFSRHFPILTYFARKTISVSLGIVNWSCRWSLRFGKVYPILLETSSAARAIRIAARNCRSSLFSPIVGPFTAQNAPNTYQPREITIIAKLGGGGTYLVTLRRRCNRQNFDIVSTKIKQTNGNRPKINSLFATIRQFYLV